MLYEDINDSKISQKIYNVIFDVINTVNKIVDGRYCMRIRNRPSVDFVNHSPKSYG